MKVIIPLNLEAPGIPRINRDFRGVFTLGLFDTVNRSWSTHPIHSFLQSPGGLTANLKKAQIDCIIAGQLAPMALRALAAEGIHCLKAPTEEIQEALTLFQEEKLPTFDLGVTGCHPDACQSCGGPCGGTP